MLDTDTKRRIDTARDILVGKVPDPESQVGRKRSGLPLNLDRTEADGRPMAEREDNFSEREFGSMGGDTAHTEPVRLVRVKRRCSVFEQRTFPDIQC